MRPVIIYIIETFLCSGLFLLLYRMMILRKVSYGFCRRYLVITMILSATIPFLNVPLYPSETIYMNVPVMTAPEENVESTTVLKPSASNAAQNVEADPGGTATGTVSEVRMSADEKWRLFFASVYITGLALSIIIVAWGIIAVALIRRKSRIEHTEQYDLAVSDSVETPFTFMHTVYMAFESDEKTRAHILSHESSHVRHRHSVERLIMSILRSLYWFNPFMWIAERRLEEVQEWQADHDALEDGYDLTEYRISIIKQLFGCDPEMASGLKSTFTKKRFLQMKQPEIKGGSGPEALFATLLAALLFICFGCGPGNFSSPVKNQGYRIECKDFILSADHFFDADYEAGVLTRRHYVNYKSDATYRNKESVEIYENFNLKYPVTIAVNGADTASSPNDRALRWVDESTTIIIGHKKSTLEEFKALKEGEYGRIIYNKPRGKQKQFAFVYVEKNRYDEVPSYNYEVKVDRPDLEDMNDIVSPRGFGFYEGVFVYQANHCNVAVPEAKFVIDGERVDYDTFRDYLMHNSLGGLNIFRNDAARKLFGDDAWEVVEINHKRRTMFISYFQNENGEPVPTLGYGGKQPYSYDEIAQAVNDIKQANRAAGELTLIMFRVETYVPDSTYIDLINKCIGNDEDVKLLLTRFKETIKKENGVTIHYNTSTDKIGG